MSLLRIPSEVLTYSRFLEAEPGEIVLRAGDSKGEVLLIESGLVQVDRKFPDGNRSVRIAGPGELVGEEALLGEPYAQQVEVLKTVGLRVIHVANAQPQLSAVRWLLGRVTQQLQQTDREIHWMRVHTVDSRVQLHLLSLFEKADGGEIPITQSDFAQLVGATRETISTSLNRLARADVIRLSRGSILVLKPESLNGKG
jgi:CRP/FNR family transcriptional regulator, cyclic AMP receptor protein